MRLCILALIALYSSDASSQMATNKEYVRLYYGGITDKPIPELILSVDSFYTDDLWFYGVKIHITKCELYTIQSKLLLNNSFGITDSLHPEFFNIELYGLLQKIILRIPDKRSTAKLFDQILQELIEPADKDSMKSYMRMVLSRSI